MRPPGLHLVLVEGGIKDALPWADRAVAAAPWSGATSLDRATLRSEAGAEERPAR